MADFVLSRLGKQHATLATPAATTSPAVATLAVATLAIATTALGGSSQGCPTTSPATTPCASSSPSGVEPLLCDDNRAADPATDLSRAPAIPCSVICRQPREGRLGTPTPATRVTKIGPMPEVVDWLG